LILVLQIFDISPLEKKVKKLSKFSKNALIRNRTLPAELS